MLAQHLDGRQAVELAQRESRPAARCAARLRHAEDDVVAEAADVGEHLAVVGAR